MSENSPGVCRRWAVRAATLLPWFGLLAGGMARAAEEVPSKTWEVETIRDVAYYDGADADKIKHKLDLYLPRDRKDFPVLIFIHGGAWTMGDKNYFGLHSGFGRLLAAHGVGTVVINYRLSPGVKHPEHIKDVARAFAWTHKNIGKYGGRADQIFVTGHSAGAHLAALLATDETYLKAHGLSLRDIKGVIPMSGVYVIRDLPLSFGFNVQPPGPGALMVAGNLALRLNPARIVFGDDPKVLKDASPLTHVNPRCPPFLIVYGDCDFPTCDGMSEQLCKALKEQKCEAQTLVLKDRNHLTVIFKASREGDPAAQAILDFIKAHTRK
jgi:acetyl esterase/lipase